MYRNILAAVDGTEHSAKAAKQAALLARMAGAKLVLFHAAGHPHRPPYTEGLDTAQPAESSEEARSAREVGAKRMLAAVRKELGFQDLSVEEVIAVSDQPYAAILEAAARHDCDLIVMAPHGHRGMAAVLLGSETQKVLTHARISVLVVR